VSDEDLIAGAHRAARQEGVCVAPEAGALVVALERLVAGGWIAPEERVVLFNTGTGLKYAECM